MTVTKLIKELEKIKKKSPRALVVVDTKTVGNPDYSHDLIHSVDVQILNWTDEDGYTSYNKDGSERQKLVVVLGGL